jgi:acetamidase/formamidase
MTLKSKERTEALGATEPALHTLRATPKTCHWGYFDASLAPALRIKSGDIVRAEAVTHHAGDAPELLMDEGITAIFDGIPENDRNPGVHIMTGPIYIEEAKAGDIS